MATMPVKSNEYQPHPASEIFPMMADEQYAEFREDVRKHGLQSSGLLFEGKILDGRNRYRAALELCVEMNWSELEAEDNEGFDAIEYVLTHNLHRRHLTASQRADVAAKLATMKHGGDRKSCDQELNLSLDSVAKQLNVSVASVKSAKQVQAKGSDEVNAAVAQGKLPVSVAAKLVSAVPDKAEQTEIVAQGKTAVKQAVATEWEDVDDDEPAPTPKKQKGTDGRTTYKNNASACMQFAQMAILQLERIQPDDKDRDAAFQKVACWLSNNGSGGANNE